MGLREKNDYIKEIKIAIIILTVIATFPCIIVQISNDCDNSGMYFLNIMSDLKMKFGTNCMFTYGPLGFLYNTINLGNNAIYASVFYFLAIISEIWLLWNIYLRFNKKNDIKRIVLSFLMIIAAAAWMQKDYFLCLLFFMAISMAWIEQKNILYLIYACVLTDILCLIKFNTGVQCGITLFLFVIGKIIFDKKIEKRYVICLLGCGLGYLIMFLLYNPSISGLVNYIRTNLEISSGYSSAMSISPDPIVLCCALICLFCYVITIIIGAFFDKKDAYYLFIFSGAFFQTFKHGFVRADGHVYIFFAGFLIVMAVLILFVDFENVRKREIRKVLAGIVIIMNIIPLFYMDFSIHGIVDGYRNKINEIFCGIPHRMENNIMDVDDDILPEDILDEIGEKTVAILPDELSIGAYNSINMVVMPSLQSMMAYTPLLDKTNAQFFEGENMPEYIIFKYTAIDNRIPLLETPETWTKIYENYNAVLIKDEYLLLKRRDMPYQIETSEPYNMELISSDLIILPEDDGNYFMTLKTHLTTTGKLMKLFFQIPEVNISISYTDGTEYNGRILPEVLENGILISELPNSLESTCAVLNGIPQNRKVKQIKIDGPGWKYYKEIMEVSLQKVLNQKEYYDYSPYMDKQVYEINVYVNKSKDTDDFSTIWVDYLNSSAPSGATCASKKSGLTIQGWAVDVIKGQIAKSMYLQVGEHYFKLLSTERQDVIEYLNLKSCNIECGFEGWISMQNWETGNYNMKVIFQGFDDKYYTQELGELQLTE